ncbi:MORN repeat-containing protein 3 [Folsomia candida]|uniref:MORN repeat-containing protein 3 n=1 Tax=Folsomia candida TaxID=158441 RepID=UPI001605291A|nr:MORN repeat-containing protein 3 [Folsomia candida]
MPFLKNKDNRITPKWKSVDNLTHRNGYRAAVFGKSIKEKYTGWFKDNMKHGKGYQVYENQTFYEGDWANDKRNGHGYLSFVCPSTKKTLRIYTGEWKDDFPSSEGMKSFPDGGLYKGEFKFGKRHGWGCMYYADGGIYIGQWVKDMRHGVGRYLNHETGNYYEGSYKVDKKCGLGRYHYLSTGQVQEGVWFDDFPEVTEMRDDLKRRDGAPRKTEFEIPPLTILMDPHQVYLSRAHEILDKVKEVTME